MQFAPIDLLPKQPKAGYTITPDIIAMTRMTMQELLAVENFTIENEFGKIKFLGKADLSGVDLA